MRDRQTRGFGFGQTPVIHSGAPQRGWRSGIAVWGSGMRKLERKKRTPRAAKTWEGLLCIGVMLVVLGVGNGVLGLNNKVLLMVVLLADVALAVRCGWSWNDLAPVMCRKIGDMAVMFLIFCGIGFVTGSWMVSGTIPVLAGKLVMLILPNDVLWMAFLMCAAFSVIVGSNFCVMGTIGIVACSVAQIQGVPAALAASACICGATASSFFSPLADALNQVGMVFHCPPSEVIRRCAPSALIAMVLTTAYYWVLGKGFGGQGQGASMEEAQALVQAVETWFHVSWTVLIPVFVVAVLLLLRLPAGLVLLCSGFSAIDVGVFCQGFPLVRCVEAAYSGFRCDSMLGDGVPQTLRTMVDRGGILSMADGIIYMILILMCLSVMERLQVFRIAAQVFGRCRTRAGLLCTTLGLSVLSALILADNFPAMLITHDTLQESWRKHGVEAHSMIPLVWGGVRMVTSCLPWGFAAQYSAGIYGISVREFIPCALFFPLVPAAAMVLGLLGLRTSKRRKGDYAEGLSD